jgi:hypothetical protein
VASAPRSSSEPVRPRLLSRVVRRLIGRRPPRRADGHTGVGGAAGAATPVGAGVVGELPVRVPWTVMRWWQGFRARRAAASAVTRPASFGADRADRTVGARPPASTPGSARPGLPVTSGITLQRSALRGTSQRARGALSRPPASGPDVRPGHELTMRPAAGSPVVGQRGIGGADSPVGYHFGVTTTASGTPAVSPGSSGRTPAATRGSTGSSTGSSTGAAGSPAGGCGHVVSSPATASSPGHPRPRHSPPPTSGPSGQASSSCRSTCACPATRSKASSRNRRPVTW